eukprot:c3191_g1_i1.p1 GENE.c3191_g1_i1~~c3191_g1_i1.p1  ORF type:complete len:437 (+),score=90.40 c3191_g1_i1:118-1428(+)
MDITLLPFTFSTSLQNGSFTHTHIEFKYTSFRMIPPPRPIDEIAITSEYTTVQIEQILQHLFERIIDLCCCPDTQPQQHINVNGHSNHTNIQPRLCSSSCQCAYRLLRVVISVVNACSSRSSLPISSSAKWTEFVTNQITFAEFKQIVKAIQHNQVTVPILRILCKIEVQSKRQPPSQSNSSDHMCIDTNNHSNDKFQTPFGVAVEFAIKSDEWESALSQFVSTLLSFGVSTNSGVFRRMFLNAITIVANLDITTGSIEYSQIFGELMAAHMTHLDYHSIPQLSLILDWLHRTAPLRIIVLCSLLDQLFSNPLAQRWSGDVNGLVDFCSRFTPSEPISTTFQCFAIGCWVIDMGTQYSDVLANPECSSIFDFVIAHRPDTLPSTVTPIPPEYSCAYGMALSRMHRIRSTQPSAPDDVVIEISSSEEQSDDDSIIID